MNTKNSFLSFQRNGYIVASYDVGGGQQSIVESRKQFHDGQYHYVTFIRNGGNATLRVDDFPAMSSNIGGKYYKNLFLFLTILLKQFTC